MTEPAPAERRPTIMEVAKLAGVSHQTVSRYIRFNSGVKPETKARLDAAIAELGYRPNLVARSMRTRRTGRLAVLVPELEHNPSRMLSGASDAAHHAGYSIDVLSVPGGAVARAARIVELADSGQVEGVLSFSPVSADSEGRFATAGTAVVVAAEFDDQMRGIGELTDASPVVAIIERLAELGHRRFFHVAGGVEFASARARTQAYLDTVARLGLESIGVHDGEWSGESGVAAMHALPEASDRRPTAVIAANDLIAAGVLRGAHERGWSVPGDLSVTGWDDDPMGRFLTPTLTTVRIDLELLGRTAMERLISVIRDETPPTTAGPLTRVIWRESTAVAPS
ncbi:LacI family DNA-binding transcriptional regulator [Agromyces sp. MMS24-JH15]|uniref:LacI family DNA-binding transcriptional regulator n=1 Tax=Agromyces sp. MMS24-JH15 TaxID=3243765 RepID=UPI003749835D